MPILAVALICWIAAGCLTIGYVANMTQSTADVLDMVYAGSAENARAVDRLGKRLTINEDVANYAKDNARMARRAAEDAQKAIDEHEADVKAIRQANLKAAQQASKPRRRHDR
jgi:16S rRNA C1402 (ribose-2'-O) methylase RsmI